MFFGDTPFADTPNEGYGEKAESEEAGKEEVIELWLWSWWILFVGADKMRIFVLLHLSV